MNRSDVIAAKQELSRRLLTRPETTMALAHVAALGAPPAVAPSAPPRPTGITGATMRRAGRLRFAATATAAPRADVLAQAVHGVGVGRKLTDGKATRELAVRLYVPVKLPKAALDRDSLLPATIDGIPTDVVEADPPRLMQSLPNRNRHRPLVGGISIGNRAIGAGTLGYFCRSVRTGDDPRQIYVLSNNHVLANNDALPRGEPVFQPGRIDSRPPYETIARLARAVPVVRGSAANNFVDAAIALVIAGMPLRRNILNVGRVSGTGEAGEGDLVCKSGRTTGVTHGKIDDESVDELVGLDPYNPALVARFRNQLRIVRAPAPAGRHDDGDSEFSRAGDSGSLVVTAGDDRPAALGLFFAGATGYGLANPIDAVLRALQIELL
jgi:hypothetical protein